MITYVLDRFKGYFDNLRSDDFFLNQTEISFSASRIQGWSDRHFLLVNTGAFSKEQIQNLNERVRLWNPNLPVNVLSKLSKDQIKLFQHESSYLIYYKPTKVYKLVVSRQVQNEHFVKFAWNHFSTDAEKRSSLFKMITPNLITDFSILNEDEFFHLVKQDFSLIQHLKTKWITREFGDWVAKDLDFERLRTILSIKDESARNVLYRTGQMYYQWDLYKAFITHEIMNDRFYCINTGYEVTLSGHLADILDEYLLYKPDEKFIFKISDNLLMDLWGKAKPRVKHALRLMIDQHRFQLLAQSDPSNLYEILGEDVYFEFIKKSPETFKDIWNRNNFIKEKFLKFYDLKLLLEHIGISAFSDEDLKILIGRDPLLFCNENPEIAKRLSPLVVQAFIDKNIPFNRLPSNIAHTAEDMKARRELETLDAELKKLERYEVRNYKNEKEAFLNKLNKCQIRGEKRDALQSRLQHLNENDDEILFTVYSNQVDPGHKEAEEYKKVLAAADKLDITTLYDLKELDLYVANAEGKPNLSEIFKNLKTVTNV